MIDSGKLELGATPPYANDDTNKGYCLNRYERWTQIEPISLDGPWDMSGD